MLCEVEKAYNSDVVAIGRNVIHIDPLYNCMFKH